MSSPTILLKIDETDNGINTTITDVTTWADATNTGVTAVTITMGYPTSSVYTVLNVSMSQPCSQSALSWSIPSSAVGFGTNTPFMDNIYTIVVTYTASPTIAPLTAQVYFDWNAKFYDFLLVRNLPYYLDNDDFAFNREIESSVLFNTMLRGAQFNAIAGQTTKLNDIMNIISKYVKITRERKGFDYRDWVTRMHTQSITNEPYFPGYTP